MLMLSAQTAPNSKAGYLVWQFPDSGETLEAIVCEDPKDSPYKRLPVMFHLTLSNHLPTDCSHKAVH